MQHRHLIAITGGSGSGKTTLLRNIETAFDPTQVCVICLDDYYRDRDAMHIDFAGFKNFDQPSCIDLEAFAQDTMAVLNGQTRQRLEYNFNNPLAAPARIKTYQPAPVVVVEGLFVFEAPGMVQRTDLSVFVNAPLHLKLIRRIRRDNIERNYDLTDVMHRYEHHVAPAYFAYIEPHHQRADIVINNNTGLDKGFDVLKAYIRTLV